METIEEKLIAEDSARMASAWRVIRFHDPESKGIDAGHMESVIRLVEKLGIEESLRLMQVAMRIAAIRGFDVERTYLYFFGCCWNTIRSRE